jgi:1,4-dihydroxy-2-naphthoyl-CoA hydrolase
MSVFQEALTVEEINKNWLPRLEQSLGLQITAIEGDVLKAEFTVKELMLQPHGIMHGGIACVIGESMGSMAGNMCLKDPIQAVVGQNLQALHMRPARAGAVLEAITEALHLGRRSQIWQTRIREKLTGKMIAQVTLTVAVIERGS